MPLKRSQRTRRSAIPDGYEVYLQEHDFDISDDSDRSRGSRFFCPSHTTRIVESDRAIYFEDDFGFDDSNGPREPQFREESVFIPSLVVPDRDIINPVVDEPTVGQNEPIVEEQDIPVIADTDVPLRRSQRTRRSAIPDDYEVYLQEHDFDISDDLDPITYEEAISSSYSNFWLDAMEDEMKSMASNDVWDLVELPEGSKPIGCKWVFKTKRDSNGQVERYKARLVAKRFSQKEGIDYIETFSPVSTKDSFTIIMAIVVYSDRSV
ncbi:hypothetical protein FA727_23840 [Robertmurraya kyonggiensis]|uniref:Reverse transcriptase Ty1/copia-type domain-containing protein n=1 Tax=Robertmurraya kyonggiensis TaxID=1037680 RepID=A0A4U1CS84_9BACI|nr:hypothetical protein FA727_23840 [Robertmurraya kyonggiensis]